MAQKTQTKESFIVLLYCFIYIKWHKVKEKQDQMETFK